MDSCVIDIYRHPGFCSMKKARWHGARFSPFWNCAAVKFGVDPARILIDESRMMGPGE